MVPGAAKKDDMMPSHRIADLQRAGQDSGSGGSLEGVSELQPIPKLSPRAAAEEEAEYGQMVEEMQQVSICLSVSPLQYIYISQFYRHFVCACLLLIRGSSTPSAGSNPP